MEVISQWPAVAQVITFVIAFNVLIGGIKAALDLIKDKTATQLDNKAAAFISKIADLLGKLLDIVGYNKKHD